LHLDDESTETQTSLDENQRTRSIIRRKGEKLLKSGIRKYVRIRITGFNFKPRRIRPPSPDITTTSTTSSISYHPSQFHHTDTPPSQSLPQPLTNLEIPDFELWFSELWHDFLIEPTPYLVASAICYLGGVLVLVQYYVVIWRVCCFLMWFVPGVGDEGFG